MRSFVPAGFFVLRTPLLPFDTLIDWVEGIAQPGAVQRPADRALLRSRLKVLVAQSCVREAIFVASPDLENAIPVWEREPDSEQGLAAERGLVRYLVRMASRSTPFGLCAGISYGRLGHDTQLKLGQRAGYRRSTRIGMDYLFAWTEELRRDPRLRGGLAYRPNPGLYRTASSLRYVLVRADAKGRTFHLVSVEETPYLAATLLKAANTAKFEDLCQALVEDEVTLEDAGAYVAELIDSQILEADLALPLTGAEPALQLADQLRSRPLIDALALEIDTVRAELAAMDAGGVDVSPARYRAAAQKLPAQATATPLGRIFQVDMVKPGPDLVLGRAVLEEMGHGIEILIRLARPQAKGELARFREAFSRRFEEREVPLTEALDEESGVGFEAARDPAPGMRGLEFPPVFDSSVPWRAREQVLLQLLAGALQDGRTEIVLSSSDLARLGDLEAEKDLPASFSAMATLAASSAEAVSQGRFRIFLQSVETTSGARMLGRFCAAEPELELAVRNFISDSDRGSPGVLHAEVVHLPEGHHGNFLCRPLLREYEIPYLGSSGAPADHQIPVSDLMVSVRGDRIVLRSLRLGKEVRPHLTNAHNFALSPLGIYRFLCLLERPGMDGGMAWDWGVLEGSPFLPRVSHGRTVFSLAQWRLEADELKSLHGPGGLEEIQALRRRRRLPRWVLLGEGDLTWSLDLDNALAVESALPLIRRGPTTTLRELYPGPEDLCATGPEGRFAHEIILPYQRRPPDDDPKAVPARADIRIQRSGNALRSCPPGSEWVYAKFYLGSATGDRVLTEELAPLVKKAFESGAADQWFFIRYGDPDWHLRLRFHGDPSRLQTEVVTAVQGCASRLLSEGKIWRFQLDTYEREIERYGGGLGMGLAERLFQADSEAVLAVLQGLSGSDEAFADRWRAALLGVDLLLGDFGYDLPSRARMLASVAKDAAGTPLSKAGGKTGLNEKFRQERPSLEALLTPNGASTALAPVQEILRQRSVALAPICMELRDAERERNLEVPMEEFALSCVHMHVNRVLRVSDRLQESVIYDFLVRLYRSRMARKL